MCRLPVAVVVCLFCDKQPGASYKRNWPILSVRSLCAVLSCSIQRLDVTFQVSSRPLCSSTTTRTSKNVHWRAVAAVCKITSTLAGASIRLHPVVWPFAHGTDFYLDPWRTVRLASKRANNNNFLHGSRATICRLATMDMNAAQSFY